MGEQAIQQLLDMLAAEVDTRFDGAQGDYRALIVINPTDAPYTGVAVLHVDMPLKAGSEPRPAAVWTPDGVRAPCQILNSRLEPVSEWRTPDGAVRALPAGSRRWRFDMAFWVENLPPRSYRVYRSAWSADELPLPAIPDAEPPVRVREALPHAGALGKEGALDEPATESRDIIGY
ncbi:MAG: hypothetical protein WHS44_11415 [Fimbriimonadales bacterium]|nr:MAG: hypothetical protein KatS3mg018_0080 [Fimbriimonadales bacterium]